MSMFVPIAAVSDRVMTALIAGLEIEFGPDVGAALAARFLEAEGADFHWDARVRERWLGAYESLDDSEFELDRVAIIGRLGERGDIIRTMQRELTARRLERAGVDRVIADPASGLADPIVGRVIHRGFADEHHDRHYLMVDGVDGRVHYLDIGRSDATEPTPEGAIVRVVSRPIGARDVDRTVARIAAANNGRYSVDLHLPYDPNASEAFAEAHVRRLEAMRRAGAGVEREADGSWTIAADHVDRAAAYEQRQLRDRPVDIATL